ncbi:alpha/beta hydrolase [Chitinophaga rhizophila]|uniref:Alpha/beta hydrolase n=1 Tax=Chitinophaga rhizophila TaxID=2866212 RepID=A0ABS7GIP4_9BACT|nr:alpha/beta hydrolase [Chitinophaga rhizophila]MBW8687562.1 alpha/beta hydrolase [Chitinophaga rhizophila]
MKKLLYLFLLPVFTMQAFAQQQEKDIIYLWPGAVPGETAPKKAAVPTSDSSRGVTRLTDVTDPIMQVFLPEKGKANGAGIVICPGGGYQILAINLEGYEIARWLNQLGYTAFVLQYRVPQKQEGALQDVQRALRIVRGRAATWQLQKDKIGVLGFSAGGSLSARASTLYNKQTYTPVDDSDKESARPDFALLIYPAYLDQGANRTLTPELQVDKHTPPVFLFATADDTYANSALVMAGALRDAKVPVELHIYATGGHGYGLRPDNSAGKAWPLLAADWLRRNTGEK